MADDLDKILRDIEAEKEARQREEEQARRMLQVDKQTEQRLQEERKSKVSDFKLQLNLDEEIPGPPPSEGGPAREADTPAVGGTDGGAGRLSGQTAEIPSAPQDDLPAQESSPAEGALPDTAETSEPEGASAGDGTAGADGQKKSARKKKAADPQAKMAWGCVRGIIYAVLVLAASGILAYFAVAGVLDLTGLNKSDTKVPVTLTEEDCQDTAKVAEILEEAGVIDQPLIFRLYCTITGANGEFMPQDEAALSADMGYETIINILKSNKREIVRVTFPEGMTVKEIAAKLEENSVCTSQEFYSAMENGTYSYAFLNEIPSDEAHAGRVNRLEGYIFPDTYDFYVGSSGETVVNKFLTAFSNKVEKSAAGEDEDSTPTSIKAKAQGMTLDEVITLASIVQWEADNLEDMYKVARVLRNRLDNPSVYPKLECDSTRRYIDSIFPPVNGQSVENLDYDTYKRNGLPVGPINNPGMDAIEAVLNPAEEMDGYYFFATARNSDGSTTTYYSKTYAEHERICRRYGIGMYAE